MYINIYAAMLRTNDDAAAAAVLSCVCACVCACKHTHICIYINTHTYIYRHIFTNIFCNHTADDDKPLLLLSCPVYMCVCVCVCLTFKKVLLFLQPNRKKIDIF